jgi:hypothetical protein
MLLINYSKHTLIQAKRFTILSIVLLGTICCNAQALSKRSFQHQQEESNKKIHFELQCNDSEQRALLLKHIAQYSGWDRHRMLSSRRKIAIEPPYNATVELYSAKELNALYGKRIHAFYSDNPKDYYEIKLVFTQSGFKEIILSEPQK